MTDKQIIIDGVDVSGCEYYDKNKPLLTCTCEEYACSECHNCYYKQLKAKEQECSFNTLKIIALQEALEQYEIENDQLKRKEQECSEYSKELARFQQEVVPKLRKRLRNKEQECEELKKQYNCYACDTCKGKEDYVNLKRHCENAIKSLHNKQAELDQLKVENEELKKLLKVRIEDLCDSCGASSMKLMPCKVYEKTLTEIKEIAERVKVYDPLAKQILQKISEVEE